MAVDDGVALLFHLMPRLLVQARRVGRQQRARQPRDRAHDRRARGERDRRESLSRAGRGAAGGLRQPAATTRRASRSCMRDTDDPAPRCCAWRSTRARPRASRSVVFAGEALPRRKGVRRVLGVRVGESPTCERIEEGLERTEQLLRRSGLLRAPSSTTPRIERHGQPGTRDRAQPVGPHYEVRFAGTGPARAASCSPAWRSTRSASRARPACAALEQRLVELYRRYGFRDVQVKAAASEQMRVARLARVRTRPGEEHVDGARRAHRHRRADRDRGHHVSGREHFEHRVLARAGATATSRRTCPARRSARPSTPRWPTSSASAAATITASSARCPSPCCSTRAGSSTRPPTTRPSSTSASSTARDGFLESSVGRGLRSSRCPSRGHAIAVIPVVEGPRTFLYDVRVENNQQAVEPRAAARWRRSRATQPFSYLKLEEARLRMRRCYQEEGYFYAKVEPSVRMSEDGTRAEVIFHVDEGYVVRGRRHRGARRWSARVASMIVNRVRFKVGDLYRPSLARETQDALLRARRVHQRHGGARGARPAGAREDGGDHRDRAQDPVARLERGLQYRRRRARRLRVRLSQPVRQRACTPRFAARSATSSCSSTARSSVATSRSIPTSASSTRPR